MVFFKTKSKKSDFQSLYDNFKETLEEEDGPVLLDEWLKTFKALHDTKNSIEEVAELHELASERINDALRHYFVRDDSMSCEEAYHYAQYYLLYRACRLAYARSKDNECQEKLVFKISELGLGDAHLIIEKMCSEDRDVKLSDEQIAYLRAWNRQLYSQDCSCFRIR